MDRRPTAPTDDPADAAVLPAAGRRAWLVSSAIAMALLLARWGPTLHDAPALTDESYYRAAIAAVGEGRPLASVPGWFYPSSGAHLAAAIAGRVGTADLFRGLRFLNLAGIAAAVGWAAAEPAGEGRRILAMRGALLVGLCALPATGTAITVGNVSGLLVGLLLVALATPGTLRGAPLAATFLLKPYGLVLAMAQRPRTALLPLACAALAWLDTPTRDGFPALDSLRNNALIRPIHTLGLPLPWQVLTAVVLLAAAVLRQRGPSALAIGWLALPLAWDHTGALLLPALGAAIARPPPVAGDARLGLVLALLAAIVLGNAGYFGNNDASAVVSGLLGLVPGVCVVFLAWAARDATRPATR